MANADMDTDRQEDSSGRSWEGFCREEAKQWASGFLDRVRRFKLRNALAREVNDSTFTNEFSAAFLEESSLLMANGVLNYPASQPAVLTTSLPASYMNNTGSNLDTENPSTRKTNSSKAKSWFSHLFKWPKSQRSRRTSAASTNSNSPGHTRGGRRNVNVLKEGVVQMLNMNMDDSSSPYAWQQCKLVLHEDHGNHQLEVYSPPKNPVPKMSLFCFLIKEVRPATSLEIPDSTTCYVIKSENHGEYVFDAGTEERKQQWISIIRSHSCHSATVTNGVLPGNSNIGSSRPRSYSIGAADRRPSLSSTLPRGLPSRSSGTDHLTNLQASHVVYGRRGSSQSSGGALYNTETGRHSGLVPRPGMESTTSEDSVLMDVSAFIRNSPYRSPSRARHRKVQSMYVESAHSTHLDITQPPQVPPTLQGAQFPYGSPSSSPPPVPKRGLRPKNVSIGGASPVSNPEPPSKPTSPPPTVINNHKRRMSQPHIGLLAPASELPSNLDTCSRSSSSSALHPVSLADLDRRGSVSPAHTRQLSQLSIEGHVPNPASSRTRKTSAPVFSPERICLDRDIVHPEPLTEATTTVRKNQPSDNFHSSPPRYNNSIFSIGSEPDNRLPCNDVSSRPAESGVQSPSDNRHTNEDMTSKATLSFPYSLRTHSPISPRDPSNRPGHDSSNSEDSPPETRRRLVPYTRLNVSSLVGSSISRNHSRENDTIIERSHSRASNNTEASEDDDTELEGAIPNTGNPLYVETTGSESYNQSNTHTQHPYENWATTPQDVQNLRLLSQYSWFHGMISRNNASQLVLCDGDSGTGQYLVRQSESREGDFVLTFNYHNRAKHLRMTVDESGCNIQHLWFDDVPGMLDYFKTNSIPLESFWLNNDVKLTTHIDRRKSDSFRTTTVVNVTRLNRVPPRRSRSLHIGMSRGVTANSSLDTPSPIDHPISSSSSSNSHSTNSLPQSARNSVGWRQLFRSQRSSSAGNMTVNGVRSGGGVGVQRRHSTNAGSLLDTGVRTSGRGSGGSSRGSGRNSQNTYVYRNY